MRYPNTAPVDPTDALAQRIKRLEAEVAELQRVGGRSAWRSYTPTLGGTGWAVNNGTLTGRALITSQRVDFTVKFVLGSTSTAGAAVPTFTLPSSTHSDWTERLLRASTATSLFDTSAPATYHGRAGFTASSTITPLVTNAAGTYVVDANVTGTAPFTFAVGDEIVIVGWYRPA